MKNQFFYLLTLINLFACDGAQLKSGNSHIAVPNNSIATPVENDSKTASRDDDKKSGSVAGDDQTTTTTTDGSSTVAPAQFANTTPPTAVTDAADAPTSITGAYLTCTYDSSPLKTQCSSFDASGNGLPFDALKAFVINNETQVREDITFSKDTLSNRWRFELPQTLLGKSFGIGLTSAKGDSLSDSIVAPLSCDGGYSLGGFCYYLSDENTACWNVCQYKSLGYDELGVAYSLSSDAVCSNILDKFGMPASTIRHDADHPGDARGCKSYTDTTELSGRWRFSTLDAFINGGNRVCSCK